MHRFSRACLAFIVPAALMAPVAAAAAPKDDAEIRALEAAFTKAVIAKDVDAVMKVYSPDIFVFDLVPPRQYVGAAAYRKDWQETFGVIKGPNNFAIKDLVIASDGTIAYSHSIQSMSGVDAKGQKLAFVVRVSDVYRKAKGGWRIVQEHVSVPVDMANGAKPDIMSKP